MWELVIAETANHWLGGFDPEGFDRYAWEGGRFRPYDPGADRKLCVRLGSILDFLVAMVPVVPIYAPLPLEASWQAQGRLSTARILPIVEVMLECGFLVERDVAGEALQYGLDPEFEWPNRWQKFPTARAAFERKCQVGAGHVAPHLKAIDLGAPANGHPSALAAIPAAGEEDAVLAALFEVLGAMPKPLPVTREAVAYELSQRKLPRSLVARLLHPDTGILRSMRQFSKRPSKYKSNLELNAAWAASYHLRAYPSALAAWRVAIGKKPATGLMDGRENDEA